MSRRGSGILACCRFLHSRVASFAVVRRAFVPNLPFPLSSASVLLPTGCPTVTVLFTENHCDTIGSHSPS